MPLYVLYDGRCSFCTAQMERLLRFARPGALEPVDFQRPGALDRFPGLTLEACRQALHVVSGDGRVYVGAEAAARALATRTLGKPALLYYVPGVRQICDAAYRAIAARRYGFAR